jgi:NADPH:quinone reductase-like Zn-dependent oxidoreductase
MKAIVQDSYGSPDVLVLGEIDEPMVGDHDVLVRVHAAGVDPGVWHVMAGLPYLVRVMGFGLRAPKVRVRGMDVAGRVEAVGGSVTRVAPGDDVYGTRFRACVTRARFERDSGS